MKTQPQFERLCDYKNYDLRVEQEEKLLKYALQLGPPMLKGQLDCNCTSLSALLLQFSLKCMRND